VQACIGDATRDTRHNPRKVKQLTGDLEELKGEIRSFQAVVTAAAIAAGVPLYLGACIASFTSGYGLGFGIVGAVPQLTDILMASPTIQQLSIKVARDQAAMDDGSRQVAFFGTLVTNLDDLMKSAQAASEQMKDLMAAWSALEAALRSVVDDLQDAAMDAVRLDIPGLAARAEGRQHRLGAAPRALPGNVQHQVPADAAANRDAADEAGRSRVMPLYGRTRSVRPYPGLECTIQAGTRAAREPPLTLALSPKGRGD
jgi:hypothetical protein